MFSCLFLLILSAVVLFGLWFPYRDAQSFMVSGAIELQQQQDGTLKLTWPQAQKADRYQLQIYKDNGTDTPPIYVDVTVAENFYVLPQLPDDCALTISIHTVVDYNLLWKQAQRLCAEPLRVTAQISVPEVNQFQWHADPDSQTVTLSYTLGKNESCRLSMQQDASWTDILETKEQSITLDFSEQGNFAVPALGESLHFRVSANRIQSGIHTYGESYQEFSICREDLLSRELNLALKNEGYNVCSLTWNETKGEHYLVQQLDVQSDTWTTVAEIPCSAERTYTSPHMPVNQTVTYRVVAVGGQVMADSDYAAISNTVEQKTTQSPIFCTLWAIKDMPAYTTPQKDTEAGTVTAGSAWCVLEETDGMFGIRLNGETCYIDSNYCLINLPEYLGELCSYDISNSYSSIYMVHEFEIPKVTDVVTAGYENIKLDSGVYLVPLLYPAAQRLADAAHSALEQGYQLKIYDAFRPKIATLEIYDLTMEILKNPLPEKPFTDKKTIDELKLPAPKTETNPETGEETTIPLTYEDVMVNAEFSLGNFLAKGTSTHNYGVSLDLTMVDLRTGEELEMQSTIHDLSRYSVLTLNNENANILNAIMTGVGFSDLLAEWWHFQDSTARTELNPPALMHGVSAACWMADDYGWRYRKADGNYYADCEAIIDSVNYTFDVQGYVVSEILP